VNGLRCLGIPEVEGAEGIGVLQTNPVKANCRCLPLQRGWWQRSSLKIGRFEARLAELLIGGVQV